MSNESFDKKIKNKLEQFDPEFQEQDWDDFAPLLRAQSVWWNRSRKTIAYAAAAVAFLLLTFQNYNLSIENKQLHSEILKSVNEKQRSLSHTTTGKDTIYIVHNNYIYRENEKSDVSDKIAIAPAMDKNVEADKNSNSGRKSEFANSNANQADSGSTADMQSNDLHGKDLTGADQSTEVVLREKSLPLAALETHAFSEKVSSLKKIQIKRDEEESPAPNPIVKTAKPRRYFIAAGLSTLLRDDYQSAGLSAMYSFGKHFQVSTGLQYGQGYHESFRDNDEFKEHHKIDFRNKFNQPVPANVKFTNIHSRTHQWTVPITFYYKYPLNKWLEAFAGAGTSLDVYAAQNFAYQYSENGNIPVSGKLPIQQSGFKVNQLVVSAGLQANIKSFIVRAEPLFLIDKNFGNAERHSHQEPGFRAEVLYRF